MLNGRTAFSVDLQAECQRVLLGFYCDSFQFLEDGRFYFLCKAYSKQSASSQLSIHFVDSVIKHCLPPLFFFTSFGH